MRDTDPATDSEVRFWHRGKTPPVVDDFLPLMNTPLTPEYDGEADSGNYTGLVAGITEALACLQRTQLPITAAHGDERQQQFVFSLLSLTGDVHERVELLKQLGTFIFRRTDSAATRQKLLRAAVADSGDNDPVVQAKNLMAIWRPTPKSFLDALLQRPAEAARALSRRLSAKGQDALSIVHHDFETLASEERDAFVRSGVVAYLKDGTIHLLGGVGQYLGAIDGGQTGHGLSCLQVLLMHEIVEALLLDSTELDAMAAHIVATTFERCLGGSALPMAVESFFVEWESNHLCGQAPEDEDVDPIEAWQDCMVDHDELRPEAFVQHSTSEQRQILKEMFGDEWTEEDEAEMVPLSVAAG